MSIRVLVFDFGNVVSYFSHRRSAEQLAPFAAVDAETLYRFLYDTPLDHDYERGRLSTAEFIDEVRRGCGVVCPDDVFAECYANIFWPNEEVCNLLPAFAERFSLLLLSNTNELHARRFRVQFAEPFRNLRQLVLSYEVGQRKPHPGIYEHARKRAGCRPDEMLLIDDIPENVEGARGCGWHGIVYTGIEDLLGRLRLCGPHRKAASGQWRGTNEPHSAG